MTFDGRLLGGVSVLAAVVETGNFVRAAEALGLTPSGVSRAVARLEARVGVRLLDRTPRSVSLTDEGRRFHAQVAPLLAGLEEAATQAAGTAQAVQGRLRVNVDPWVARLVLAPRLSAFLAAHPLLSLELLVRDAFGDLISEGVDVAVRFGEPEPSSLIARKLLETRIRPRRSCLPYPARLAPAPARSCTTRMPALPRPGHRPPLSVGVPSRWQGCRGQVNGKLIFTALATNFTACAAGHGIAQTIEFGPRAIVC